MLESRAKENILIYFRFYTIPPVLHCVTGNLDYKNIKCEIFILLSSIDRYHIKYTNYMSWKPNTSALHMVKYKF